MNPPAIIITPAAEMDIAEALNWYESINPALAPAFRGALAETLRRIVARRETYTPIARGLRRAFLHRFPHGVFYRNHDDGIQVVAVLHPSRSPEVWQGRNH